MKLLTKSLMLLLALSFLAGGKSRAQEQDDDSLEKAGESIREAFQRVMIPRSRLADGPQVRKAYRDVVAKTLPAAVRVKCDGKNAALGGIVGSDGWIITKASQLEGDVKVKLHDDREFEAKIVGVDREYDLAMLKIDAHDLPVVDMLRDTDGDIGQLVATVGTDEDPVAVGILSVDTRRIRHQPGILGVQLDQVQGGARVVKVFPETGAATAGVLVNDIISAVNGKETPNREALIDEVRKFSPGDEVELTIKRSDKELTAIAVLTGQPQAMPVDRRDFQNNLGSQLSQRRFGFPQAFQHDTVLRITDCGGPLVNLDGKVVGFNIARSGRVESYAIPCNVMIPRMFDLMSGNLAPRPHEDLTEPQEPMADEAAAATPTSDEQPSVEEPSSSDK